MNKMANTIPAKSGEKFVEYRVKNGSIKSLAVYFLIACACKNKLD